jgi:hypothetical protein
MHHIMSQEKVWKYQRDNQNPKIEEQTKQWSKDTKGLIRIRTSKNFWLTFGIFWPLCCLFFDFRILINPLVSFDHCVVCSSMFGFWLTLWYLLTIVLSVLRFSDSDYSQNAVSSCPFIVIIYIYLWISHVVCTSFPH